MKTSILAFLLLLHPISLESLAAGPTPAEHERLRIKNTFSKPEDVVRYYCGRDASGFVWSGLLDIERQAFTFWDQAPQRDSFLIAKNYEIKPAKLAGAQQTEATVEVTYNLTGMGDPHGSRLPGPSNPYQVTFNLKKVNGTWKIEKPEPADISPVVMESKFPTGTP